MQITEQTDTVLKLQGKSPSTFPFGPPPLTLGALVVLFSLGSLLVASRIATLKCDRVEPTQVACQLTFSTLLGQKQVTEIPLGQLQGAELKSFPTGDDDGSVTLQAVLITESGPIPMTNYSAANGQIPRNVDRIASFLQNEEQTTLEVRQSDFPFGSVPFLAIGGLMMAQAIKGTSLCFDKKSGQAQFGSTLFNHQIPLFNRQIPLLKIEGVTVATITSDNDGKTYGYCTWLILKNSHKPPITISSSPSPTEQQEIAAAIAQFSGIPLLEVPQEVRESSEA